MTRIGLLFGAIAFAGLSGATTANAATYDVTINWSNGPAETFVLDTSAGQADGISSDFVYYNISKDSLGLNSIYFGDSAASGWVGTGVAVGGDSNIVSQQYSAYFSPALYSGSGLMTSLATGQTYVADDGTTLTAAVPEPSTWALMLLGVAGLGVSGYRGSRKSLVAA